MDKIKKLISDYIKYAKEHGNGTENGDYIRTNKAYGKIIETYKEIIKLGEEGQQALLELLKHNNLSVSGWAATHSLEFAEENAIHTLENNALCKGIIAFDAKMVLEEWKKGTLVIPK